jgi:dTDP-4-amino-4,6-dideoxygalactose transaminase
MDPRQVAQKLTPKTKAIIPVHLFGCCADMDAIRQVLPPSVAVIEDAACAAGASYKGQMAGTLGDMGVFSFHPRKSMTTGEGGMLTTNEDRLAEMAQQLRNHGASVSEEQRHMGPKPYLLPEFNLLGYNYRMTDLQGSVGLVQLGKLEQYLAARNHWATYYQNELGNIPWLRLPCSSIAGRHGWQAFVCYVEPECAPISRNALMEQLQQQGISTRPGTHAVHMLGYYQQRFGIRPEDYPVARNCDQQTLAIPLHNKMTPDDFAYVVSAIQAFC